MNQHQTNKPMKTKAEQLIDGLVEAAEAYDAMTSEPSPFKVGDVVKFAMEEQEYVGIIESEYDDFYTVRVQAVAGDEFEPTDKLYDLEEAQMQKYAQSLVKGDMVSWDSTAGKAHGIVTGVSDKGIEIEVYAEHEQAYEATGVSVTHNADALSKQEFAIAESKRKLMCKMDNISMTIDEEAKVAIIEGWASTYGNVDLGGDTVAKGAYTQTLKHKNGKVKLFTDHYWDMSNLKGIAYLEDKEGGLWMKGMLPIDSRDINDTYVKVKFLVDHEEPIGLSIGYNPVKSTMNADGTRTLNEIALKEVSITPFPMDTEANILSARAKSIYYKSMKQKWATIQNDAPDGNHNEQGDEELLAEVKTLLTQIKKQ